MKNIQHKNPNFKGKNSNWYLVRCFKCEPENPSGKENKLPAVASGICAWCGDDANDDGGKNEIKS